MRLGLVEDPDRRPLPTLGRHGDDAEVDAAVVDVDGDAAVLRDPLLGDVELAHDLDPRDDAGDHPPRHASGLAEDAVDPEADAHVLLLDLEVDVGGALVDRLAEDRVDELDDRRVVGRLAQLGDVGRLRLDLLLVLGDRLGDRASRAS